MYIGDCEIEKSVVTEEKTAGGVPLVRVEFKDGKAEHFSQLMYDKVTTEAPLDLSALRDARLAPVVEACLTVLRDWGVKISELPYFSALLTNSIDFNNKKAFNSLLSAWMPEPLSPDEVDLITLDRILLSTKKTLDDVI